MTGHSHGRALGRIGFALLLALALVASVLWARRGSRPEPRGSRDAPTRAEARDAARRLLDRAVPGWRSLQSLDRAEVSKRLNFVAYNHCTTDGPPVTPLLMLFEECRTSCSGYVYVLRGLLDVFDIPSRHTALYNIPSQGSHSLVEAEVDVGRWALLDPTFGVYFTASGRPEDGPVSMDGLQYELRGRDLLAHVVQAKASTPALALAGLHEIYEAKRFRHDYMDLRYYHMAEQHGYDSRRLLLPLTVSLDVSAGAARFGSLAEGDLPAAEAAVLAATNARLNDDDPANDVAFVITYLGQPESRRQQAFVFVSGLERGRTYALALRIHNHNPEAFPLQAAQVGGGIVFRSGEPVTVGEGMSTSSWDFRATGERSIVLLRSLAESGYVRLLGIEIRALPDPRP